MFVHVMVIGESNFGESNIRGFSAPPSSPGAWYNGLPRFSAL